MLVDEPHERGVGRSSSAAKKADAVFRDRVRPTQLTVLPLQLDQTTTIITRDPRLGAGVDLGLLHPAPQGVAVDPQLLRDAGARPRHGQLQTFIGEEVLHQTDSPITKLDRVLLRCRHDSTLPWDQCLHQTRGGSSASNTSPTPTTTATPPPDQGETSHDLRELRGGEVRGVAAGRHPRHLRRGEGGGRPSAPGGAPARWRSRSRSVTTGPPGASMVSTGSSPPGPATSVPIACTPGQVCPLSHSRQTCPGSHQPQPVRRAHAPLSVLTSPGAPARLDDRRRPRRLDQPRRDVARVSLDPRWHAVGSAAGVATASPRGTGVDPVATGAVRAQPRRPMSALVSCRCSTCRPPRAPRRGSRGPRGPRRPWWCTAARRGCG